jgi:hypothetical protein
VADLPGCPDGALHRLEEEDELSGWLAYRCHVTFVPGECVG